MPHPLGIYTTALFLTQILAAKFVPPLNEVAFAAYSRIQAQPRHDPDRLPEVGAADHAGRPAFLFRAGGDRRAVRARPSSAPKWTETVPLVPVLAMAMPLMTLQILFAPATNALGRPGWRCAPAWSARC